MLNKMKWLCVVIVILSVAACCGKPKGSALLGGDPAQVLATVNGEPITEKDVLDEISPSLKRIESDLYKLEKGGLDHLIDQRLIQQAAKKVGKGADQYINDYMKENMKEPTEEEITRFYEFRKKQMGDQKLEDVRSRITEFLRSNQENALRRKLVSELMTTAKIDIKLEPPKVEIEIGDSPTIGPKGAPVTVVEFSDYQCPFCGRARPTITQIVETYPKEVIYAFKDFPLNFHKDAQKAHEAAHCAGDQGKYWDMNKKLFANQRALSIDDLKKYAKEIGLDMARFDKCLDEGAKAQMVSKGIDEGSMVGVSGTPAFFVNGVMISGARPFSDFKEAIDAELKGK